MLQIRVAGGKKREKIPERLTLHSLHEDNILEDTRDIHKILEQGRRAKVSCEA